MLRTIIITALAAIAAVTLGYYSRGYMACGGEVLIPLAALAYAVFTKGENDEEEPGAQGAPRADA